MTNNIEFSVERGDLSRGLTAVAEILRRENPTIIFDADGTLTDINGRADRRLVGPIARVKVRGVSALLCTGRSIEGVRRLGNELGPNSLNLFDWKLLEDSHIIVPPNRDISQGIIQTDRETKIQMDSLRERFKAEWKWVEDDWGMLEGIPEPLVRLKEDFIATVCIEENGPPDSPLYRNILRWAQQVIEEERLTRIRALEVGDGSLRILRRGTHKGSGIERLHAVGAINIGSTIYVGDGRNDIQIAEYITKRGGGLVVPSNAVRELRYKATYVAPFENARGVMHFLEMYESLI